MAGPQQSRALHAVIADIEEMAEAARDIIGRDRPAWDDDRLLRLAGEAVIGRIADAASRLPDSVRSDIADVPWEDIRGIRILVDHSYHRIDYGALWKTLEEDVPHLVRRLRQWRRTHRG